MEEKLVQQQVTIQELHDRLKVSPNHISIQSISMFYYMCMYHDVLYIKNNAAVPFSIMLRMHIKLS